MGPEPGHEQQDLVDGLEREGTTGGEGRPPLRRPRRGRPRARWGCGIGEQARTKPWRTRYTRSSPNAGVAVDEGEEVDGAERARLVAASSHSSCSNCSRQRAAISNRACVRRLLHRLDDAIDRLDRAALEERHGGLDPARDIRAAVTNPAQGPVQDPNSWRMQAGLPRRVEQIGLAGEDRRHPAAQSRRPSRSLSIRMASSVRAERRNGP